jgi:hypothetical protein
MTSTPASFEQIKHGLEVGVAEMRAHVPESVAVDVLGAHDYERAEPGWHGTRLAKLRTSVTFVALVLDGPGPATGCDVAIRQHGADGGEVVAIVRYKDRRVVLSAQEVTPEDAAALGVEFSP